MLRGMLSRRALTATDPGPLAVAAQLRRFLAEVNPRSGKSWAVKWFTREMRALEAKCTPGPFRLPASPLLALAAHGAA